MNIMIINHYAGSLKNGMEYRPFYLAREWVKRGNKVDIIAADFSHLRILNPVIESDFQIEVNEGIYFHWVKSVRYKGNGIKRFLSMICFVSKIIFHAKNLVKICSPDVVISSSTYPLDTYAAQKIARLSGAIIIHEVHDMWPLTLIEIAKMPKFHPLIILFQLAENSAYKKSNAVVSLLPNAKEYMIQHGLMDSKFYYVPNGIVVSDWNNATSLPEQHLQVLNECKVRKQFICCYFGSHTNTYGLKYFIGSAKYLNENNVCLLLVGDGMEKNNFIKQANEEGYNNVIFLPPIPKQSIPSLLEMVDIVYVGGTKSKMRKFGAAMNKVYDSMMAAKPIVYAVDIPNNDVEIYNCGITVELENAQSIADAIIKLNALDKEELAQIGNNGKTAALLNYDYAIISQHFLDILELIRKNNQLEKDMCDE